MNFESIDSNVLLTLVSAIFLSLGVVLVIYGIVTWIKKGTKIATRLEEFVVPEIQEPRKTLLRRIIPRDVSGSLFNRTIARGVKKFLDFISRFTPDNMTAQIEHRLAIAGYPGNMHAGEFSAVRFIFLALGIILAFLINRDLKNFTLTNGLIGVLLTLVSYLIPNVWLNNKVKAKQDEIRRGLPDALDMLSVCASAGLGFDQALQKISDYWETDLGIEFKRMIHEMEMGVSRATALMNMSNRLDVEDLSRFITIIVQAEKMGMSYAEVLHSQAVQMRILRQYRAREISNKLPAKMIIPLALLIFPALLAVILGPVIPTLLNLF